MKSFVINLERDSQRLAHFHKQNADCDLKPERFPAFDGSTLSRNELIQNGIITEENTYSPTALGCMMSHLTLWRRAIEEQDSITIFEDDAILHQNFLSLAQNTLRQRPDFDLIFWGCNTDWPFQIQLNRGFPPTTLFHGTEQSSFDPTEPLSGNVTLASLTQCAGACSYTISPKGAEALLSRFLPNGNDPATLRYFQNGLGTEHITIPWHNHGVDVGMSRILPSLDAYICLPFLAASKNDWSISNFKRVGHSLHVIEPET
ncbi:glycosyltransferase family 25 protein [Swingsia samuiensis]|uniref:Glycosyltransferase family 25 protein n=1 Tax=Swingsia samuiensis TaxID=1293412 RepID=A0A4Y6UI78_9PROT|nr:glycosyltransferase family 25 protein [Swingsia samuiensis]QDH16754.1 glycosyltransferase family 25 protein [Swingsia samuiensis]